MDTDKAITPKVSGKKILYIGTLLLVVASVILATMLIQYKPVERSDSVDTPVINTVEDSTIQELLDVSEDGYVGNAEKIALQNYLEDDNNINDPVLLVDNLLYSAYLEGEAFKASKAAPEVSDEDLVEYDAYLQALTNVVDPEDAPEAISNYIAKAKELGFEPEI